MTFPYEILVGLRYLRAKRRQRTISLNTFISITGITLGVAALIPLLARRDDWKTVEVILATAHQANGAIFLAVVVQLFAWARRLGPCT